MICHKIKENQEESKFRNKYYISVCACTCVRVCKSMIVCMCVCYVMLNVCDHVMLYTIILQQDIKVINTVY